MDDDTLIALGYAVGAAILLVVIFFWVLIYCLRFRKSEELAKLNAKQLSSSGQFNYINRSLELGSKYGTQTSDLLNTYPSSQRYLPAIPQEHNENQYIRPVEGKQNQGYVDNSEDVYTYCDNNDISQYYSPSNPADNHNYEILRRSPAMFLEAKYNIKPDLEDDLFSQRALVSFQHNTQTKLDHHKEEPYADINNIHRIDSVMADAGCLQQSQKESNADSSCDKELIGDMATSTTYYEREQTLALRSFRKNSEPDVQHLNLQEGEGMAKTNDISTGHRAQARERSTVQPEKHLKDNCMKEIEEIFFDISVKNMPSGCAVSSPQSESESKINWENHTTTSKSEKPIPKPRNSRTSSTDILSNTSLI